MSRGVDERGAGERDAGARAVSSAAEPRTSCRGAGDGVIGSRCARYHGPTPRPIRRRWLTVLCLAFAALLLSSSPALALSQRGHVFGLSFGSEGSGEGQFFSPSGIAVNESSEDVYVVDRANNRVQEFGPKGEFILTWGWGVQNGKSEFEICKSGRHCRAGLPGAGIGQFLSPQAIAVDNSAPQASKLHPSAGDVYVVSNPKAGQVVLQKFAPNGELMGRLKQEGTRSAKESGGLDGVGVDSSGTVWVYRGESGAEVSEAGKVERFSDAAVNKFIEPALEVKPAFESVALCPRPGFAVDAAGENFYLDHERENSAEECPAGVEGEQARSVVSGKFKSSGEALEALVPALDPENTTAAAVELPTGTVYIGNETTIAAFSASGSPIQRFGSEQLGRASGIAVNAKTGQVYVADSAAEKVDVYEPEGEGKPAVEGLGSQDISATLTRLSAKINPDGAETSYVFQYATKPISGAGSCAPSCGEAPVPPGKLPAGFIELEVSVELQGLAPNTTYYYRLLAQNKNGTSLSPHSAETFFTTPPSSRGLLLDQRSWEMVSPPEKHGALVEPISREGALIQASVSGEAISWTASAPVVGEAEGNRRPEPVQVISSRDPREGWSSRDIATPHNKGEGINTGEATEYRFFSADLSLALVQPQVPTEPLENPPLSPEAREKTIYLRDNATGEYVPLVTAKNDTANTQFGGKLEFAGASPDLRHVVFGSEVPLLAGAEGKGLFEWESGAALKLLSVLPGPAKTPAGEPTLGDLARDVRGAVSTDGSRVFWTNGGNDEGPLFMRDTVKEETIQINAAQGVREASAEEIASGFDEAHFQDASSDGSRAFFTDTWPLTRESNLEALSKEEVVEGHNAGRPVDLYEFDLATGRLSDLTVSERPGEKADVLGTLPGISEDGSYVYFIANGVLAPGAQPGNCPRTNPFHLPHPQATCNLYLSGPDPEHPGKRETRLIARMSAEDAPDWGGENSIGSSEVSLGGVTSRVSSNGRFLAFMSEQELTGYHNVDANPEAKGTHDEEVFLYDASAGRLVCSSCNPSGEAPHGVFDTEAAGEGLGLLVDRPETWHGHWLAGSIPGWTLYEFNNPMTEHQSRYLSNNGRLFFNSADALAPQITAHTREEVVNGKKQNVGVENVYEYEPSGQGSCTSEPGCVAPISSGTSPHESAFLDASESGNDVFFLTAARLLAQDTDNSLDVYNARVCGTAETQPCLPPKLSLPPACTGEECRPPASPQQSLPPPASSTFSGPGNIARQEVLPSKTTSSPKPLTRAQKLARALKACRKLRPKRKRAACEARARKKYKAKAVARKKIASSGTRKGT